MDLADEAQGGAWKAAEATGREGVNRGRWARRGAAYCLPRTSVVLMGKNLPCSPMTPHVPTASATRHCAEICAAASARGVGVVVISVWCSGRAGGGAYLDRRVRERLLHGLEVVSICGEMRARAREFGQGREERRLARTFEGAIQGVTDTSVTLQSDRGVSRVTEVSVTPAS